MDRLPTPGPGGERPESSDDASRVRISDADRHRVAELLRDAAAEGRIDMDELDERLGSAYGARVAADLVPLLADLPAGLEQAPDSAPSRTAPPADVPRHDHSVAIMGGRDRRGPWAIGETHTALAVMAGVDIDLREARFTSRETVITAIAVMGGIDVIVGPDVRVVVEGIGVMGAFDEGRSAVPAELREDSPVLRVRGVALMGGVEVKRKGPPQPRRRRWGGPRGVDGGRRDELI